MFTNDTILQRAPQSSTIFGYGTPGSTVSLTFKNKVYQATITANNNNLGLGACSWRITLPATDDTNNANGIQRYNISVTSTYTPKIIINITNVTFGDIWVCTGQSNMWLPVLSIIIYAIHVINVIFMYLNKFIIRFHTYSWYNTSINQTCDEYDIRFYHTPNTFSLTPRDARTWENQWKVG